MIMLSIILAAAMAGEPSPKAEADSSSVATYLAVWNNGRQQINLRTQSRCVVDHHASVVRTVLRDDIGMARVISNYPQIVKICGHGAWFKDNTVSMSMPTYSFTLAEALVVRDFQHVSIVDIAAQPPLKREPIPSFDGQNLPRDLRESLQIAAYVEGLSKAAECVARKEPNRAFALLATEPGSKEEGIEWAELSPVFEVCGINERHPAPTPFFIRGELAVNLFKLADNLHPIERAKG